MFQSTLWTLKFLNFICFSCGHTKIGSRLIWLKGHHLLTLVLKQSYLDLIYTNQFFSLKPSIYFFLPRQEAVTLKNEELVPTQSSI